MSLLVERIPTLQDNYTYLIFCEATRQAAIVDAPEAEPVLKRVQELDVTVEMILSTHHHPDHSHANPVLAEHFQVPVLGHVSDSRRLPGFTKGLEAGDSIQLGDLSAQVLHIPAHTTGHIAYVFEDPWAVFCGDTLFAAGCGRLFEGTAEDMAQAMQQLHGFPDETLLYCGHEYTESNLRFAQAAEPNNQEIRKALEETRKIRSHKQANWGDAKARKMTVPTTLGHEKKTNPFLRACFDPQELGRLRSWKNDF